MQALNCLIIEDEPLAADVIRDYVAQVPGIVLKGICENAFQAISMLREEKIDLIFLDINLPGLSGIDFIKAIRGNYYIILTTAYHHYALESYELNVTDYLLKPVEFSRFLQAVNKIFMLAGHHIPPTAQYEKKHLFFNVDKKRIKVCTEDILFIEALKDYVRIHLEGKHLVTKLQLNEIESLLMGEKFLRIHKSFIVNSTKINAFRASEVEVEGIKLRIGRTYKKTAETCFKNLGLPLS